MEVAKNVFKNGLISDVAPELLGNSSLNHALNATILTYNGNEFCLQNDFGNIKTEGHLGEGYIPVGAVEYGGIIYLASYKKEENGEEVIISGELGSFPSPKITGNDEKSYEVDWFEKFVDEVKVNDKTYYEINSSKLQIMTLANDVLYPGDTWLVTTAEPVPDYMTRNLVLITKENNIVKLPATIKTLSDSEEIKYEGVLEGKMSGKLAFTYLFNKLHKFILKVLVENGQLTITPLYYQFDKQIISPEDIKFDLTITKTEPYVSVKDLEITEEYENFEGESISIKDNKYRTWNLKAIPKYDDADTSIFISDLAFENTLLLRYENSAISTILFKYKLNDGIIELVIETEFNDYVESIEYNLYKQDLSFSLTNKVYSKIELVLSSTPHRSELSIQLIEYDRLYLFEIKVLGINIYKWIYTNDVFNGEEGNDFSDLLPVFLSELLVEFPGNENNIDNITLDKPENVKSLEVVGSWNGIFEYKFDISQNYILSEKPNTEILASTKVTPDSILNKETYYDAAGNIIRSNDRGLDVKDDCLIIPITLECIAPEELKPLVTYSSLNAVNLVYANDALIPIYDGNITKCVSISQNGISNIQDTVISEYSNIIPCVLGSINGNIEIVYDGTKTITIPLVKEDNTNIVLGYLIKNSEGEFILLNYINKIDLAKTVDIRKDIYKFIMLMFYVGGTVNKNIYDISSAELTYTKYKADIKFTKNESVFDGVEILKDVPNDINKTNIIPKVNIDPASVNLVLELDFDDITINLYWYDNPAYIKNSYIEEYNYIEDDILGYVCGNSPSAENLKFAALNTSNLFDVTKGTRNTEDGKYKVKFINYPDIDIKDGHIYAKPNVNTNEGTYECTLYDDENSFELFKNYKGYIKFTGYSAEYSGLDYTGKVEELYINDVNVKLIDATYQFTDGFVLKVIKNSTESLNFTINFVISESSLIDTIEFYDVDLLYFTYLPDSGPLLLGDTSETIIINGENVNFIPETINPDKTFEKWAENIT